MLRRAQHRIESTKRTCSLAGMHSSGALRQKRESRQTACVADCSGIGDCSVHVAVCGMNRPPRRSSHAFPVRCGMDFWAKSFGFHPKNSQPSTCSFKGTMCASSAQLHACAPVPASPCSAVTDNLLQRTASFSTLFGLFSEKWTVCFGSEGVAGAVNASR